MSKLHIPLTYIDCNSINAIAGLLNHMGMSGQAGVLLSIQRKVSETIDIIDEYNKNQEVSNGKENGVVTTQK